MEIRRIGQVIAAVGVILAVVSGMVCPRKICSIGTSAIILVVGLGIWYWKRRE